MTTMMMMKEDVLVCCQSQLPRDNASPLEREMSSDGRLSSFVVDLNAGLCFVLFVLFVCLFVCLFVSFLHLTSVHLICMHIVLLSLRRQVSE